MVKPTTIRVILSLALTFKWNIQQTDVNSVFLNDDLQEEVYMKQTLGFVTNDPTIACKLKKVTYGLKQAPMFGMRSLIKHYSSLGSLQVNATTHSSYINNKVLHFMP